MSVVTYRGVKYDTNTPKQEARAWHDLVLERGDDNFTYRGKEYHWKKEQTNVWVTSDSTVAEKEAKTKRNGSMVIY